MKCLHTEGKKVERRISDDKPSCTGNTYRDMSCRVSWKLKQKFWFCTENQIQGCSDRWTLPLRHNHCLSISSKIDDKTRLRVWNVRQWWGPAVSITNLGFKKKGFISKPAVPLVVWKACGLCLKLCLEKTWNLVFPKFLRMFRSLISLLHFWDLNSWGTDFRFPQL